MWVGLSGRRFTDVISSAPDISGINMNPMYSMGKWRLTNKNSKQVRSSVTKVIQVATRGGAWWMYSGFGDGKCCVATTLEKNGFFQMTKCQYEDDWR